MLLDRDSYSRILDNLYDGLYFVDCDRVIRYWNKAAEKITGFTASEVIGKSCSDNILTHVDSDGNNLCQGSCPLSMTIADGAAREAEVFLHHKDGHIVPVSIRISTLTDTEGKVIGGVELFSEMSGFTSAEKRIKELEELALIDKLTQIANRTFVEKELLMRLEEQKRFGSRFGILFMDIDHFKRFNDRYGHVVGDRVLKSVAETLDKNSRLFDIVGRWGGEEFIGIIRNVTQEQLEHLGNRLRVLVESAYLFVQDQKLRVTISIGATLSRDNDSIDTIIRRADALLYKSKRDGRNRLTIG